MMANKTVTGINLVAIQSQFGWVLSGLHDNLIRE